MGVIVSLVPFRRSRQDADFMVYSITLRSKGAFDCGVPNAQIGKFGARLQHSLPRCFRPLRVSRARVPWNVRERGGTRCEWPIGTHGTLFH